jgi:hypothetical protein
LGSSETERIPKLLASSPGQPQALIARIVAARSLKMHPDQLFRSLQNLKSAAVDLVARSTNLEDDSGELKMLVN